MSKAKIFDPEFAERMQFLLKTRFDDNNSKFANAVGVAITSLNRWLIGEADPSRSNLIKVANVAGVELDWLATGKEPMEQPKTQGNKTALNFIQASADDNYTDIMDYRDVAVSAGFGVENDDYIERHTVKVESAWLRTNSLKSKDCAMFKVKGDSMEPTLADREEIIVDRSKTALTEGKIFVLNHMGTMWVKRVKMNFESIELISDNPLYNPITLTAQEADQLNVIGQVVRGYRDF